MILLENGLWAKNLNPAKKMKKAKKKELKKLYSIKMPSLKLDNSPVVDEDGKFDINFEAVPESIRDIFVYLNDKKIYYKRLDGKRGVFKDTLKIVLKNKVNKISFVAKGFDSEKSVVIKKVAIFPKGKDQK